MCQYDELDWFCSGQALIESPCECNIEPLDSRSRGFG